MPAPWANTWPCTWRAQGLADHAGSAVTSLQPDLKMWPASGITAADLQARLAVKLYRLFPGLRGSSAKALCSLPLKPPAPPGHAG